MEVKKTTNIVKKNSATLKGEEKKHKKNFLLSAELIEKSVFAICGESGLSNNTAASYKSDLLHFAQFVIYLNSKTDIKLTTKKDIRDYINFLYDQDMASSSVCRKISSIKRFFKLLASEELITNNPANLIELPKIKNRLPKYIKPQYVNKIIEQCQNDKTSKGVRDHVIIEMLQTMGLRVSELINIKTRTILNAIKSQNGNNDINSNNGKMIPVLGKGNKERYVPLKKTTTELLKKYLQLKQQDEQGVSKNKSGTNNGKLNSKSMQFLFSSYSRLGHITRESVGIILKNRALEAGLDQSLISPHILRHSFATELCKSDVNIRFVQELLGHSSISTTEIYLNTVEDKIANFIEQNHPLGNLLTLTEQSNIKKTTTAT
ncbi:MAG: tyrosine-type recombinase/integrase, partial [Alphaproteobacteria bacterium]|nr:tyrosine-type recombinase/integrase [Rickettsiales bacterium]